MISHNGEINTVRGNTNWMRAREALFDSPLFDDIAKIIPVFKDGDCHQYTNYRPISLLSSFAKLLEKIVARQLIGFLNAQNIPRVFKKTSFSLFSFSLE